MGAHPVADGARSVVWAATLPDDGLRGGFFRNGEPGHRSDQRSGAAEGRAAKARSTEPAALRRVPAFLLALLLVRGLPALLYRHRTGWQGATVTISPVTAAALTCAD